MKKNVVKAMSVGLSAITIASSLSVPVFAEESIEGGQPAEPSTASQEVETNVAEQTVVKDTAELNDSYNVGANLPEDEDTVATQIENIVDATKDTFSSDENYELEIEVVDEDGNVVEDEDGNKKTETVTRNHIQDASDAAAREIAAAATDAELIKDAADKMDVAAANADTAVGNAESAASDVTSAVNKAQQDANAAVVAVATDSQENAATLIATAQQSVADAQQTYNEKAQDLADAKSAYEDAKDALDTATKNYKGNISAAKKDLGDAETDLATLQAKVDELEKAVENAKNALAESAAGVLWAADQAYAESDKAAEATNKYIAAVIENFYLVNNITLKEGQELTDVTVTPVENTTDVMNVTYKIKDQDGNKEEKNFKIGYAINDGVVELFEKEVRYECTVTDKDGVEQNYSLSGDDMDAAVENGTAVRRYEYTDEEGKTTYLSQDQYDLKTKDATDEEKAKYTLGYVLIGAWDKEKIEGLDSDTTTYTIGDRTETVVKVEEKATGEKATTVTYFDENGYYKKIITNYTTKHVYEYTNGKLIKDTELEVNSSLKEVQNLYDNNDATLSVYYKVQEYYAPTYKYIGTVSETKNNKKRDKAISSAESARDDRIDDLKSEYREGFYQTGLIFKLTPHYNYENVTFASSNNATSCYPSGKKYYATASADYEVSYTKVNEKSIDYSTFEAIWDALLNRDQTKVNEFIKDFEDKSHVDVIGNDDDFNWDLFSKSIYYVQQYQLTGEILNEHYSSEKAAIDAAVAAAIQANAGAKGGESVAGIDWDFSMSPKECYEYYIDYVTRTDTIDVEGNNYTVNSQTKILGEYDKVYRNVQNTTDLASGYTDQITTLSNYKTLLDQLAAAKTAVDAAQDKVTDIQGKIDDLNKDGAILSLQVLEWKLRLADAQKAYDDAKATLDDAKAALNTATQAYSDKYPTIVPTTGGGATTTTGGAAPVVYATATTAAVAADEELEIPDDAVPAAGQARRARRARTVAANDNTTTIDEAETPLAGGDADDAVVEDTEDTTTVDEDLVPLAGEAQKGFFARTWWGWLLLIIAVLTGSTAYAKKKADAKKVK